MKTINVKISAVIDCPEYIYNALIRAIQSQEFIELMPAMVASPLVMTYTKMELEL